MPEGLATADGRKIDLDDVDREFAAAMAAPRSDDPEHPVPPRLAADPEAPFGRKVDGTPKKSRSGRPPKPRVTEAAPSAGAPSPPKGHPVPDYRGQLAEFAEGLWMLGAMTPLPWDEIRVKVRCQAAVVRANKDGIANGVNIMAQHNGTVRRGVEFMTAGSASWVLPAMFALTPFAVQSASIWRAPVNGDLAQMAAAVEEQWELELAQIKAELTREAEPADAGSPAAA